MGILPRIFGVKKKNLPGNWLAKMDQYTTLNLARVATTQSIHHQLSLYLLCPLYFPLSLALFSLYFSLYIHEYIYVHKYISNMYTYIYFTRLPWGATPPNKTSNPKIHEPLSLYFVLGSPWRQSGLNNERLLEKTTPLYYTWV